MLNLSHVNWIYFPAPFYLHPPQTMYSMSSVCRILRTIDARPAYGIIYVTTKIADICDHLVYMNIDIGIIFIRNKSYTLHSSFSMFIGV